MAKAKAAAPIEDKKAGPDAEAATGPETPATGNGGEAEAGEVAIAAPLAEAPRPTAPPEPSEAEAVAYVVVSALMHDGEPYADGDPITLGPEAASALLRAGAISPLPAAADPA